jgi:hypothetical protein
MSNQNPGPFGSPSAEARAEVQRIYGDFLNRKLGAGTVHLYILKPDGSALSGLGPVEVAQPDVLKRLLTNVIGQLGTRPGDPTVKPRPQSVPPKSDAGDLVLHLVSRSHGSGNWHEFPSENWLILSRPEWTQLFPRETPHAGLSWQLDPTLARKLLARFYPQTEETTNQDRNRIDEAALRLTVTATGDGVARARMDGRLRMKHAFYPGKDSEDNVDATLLDFVDFDATNLHIQRLRIVTERATYKNEAFGAALRSISAETLQGLGQ